MDAKKKNNLEATYERILNVGFCIVPYEDISDIIGPDPMVYGTAKDERILSFEGVEALFKSQYEQMGNMKPAYERKRIALRISNGGNNACIIEELTFTLSSVEEIHTIFMRATCVMEYLDNQWKLTHWHTSTPVDTENDPWHMEEWKREKEKLQQLVDEQTAALKQNNRELQIEAALEKVRSRSLAMHHSSELSAVVDTLLREFTNLEFTLTFCIINLIDEQDLSNTVWAANPETGKDPESYYMKFEDYPFHHAMWDAWKAQKKRFVYTIEGEEKKIYDQYLYNDTEFRRFPKNVQEANKALERYVAGFTFFKYSGLQTVSVNPISEDELEILERFGRVFEQAYTRFLDLQKAEAQARESEIQLSLERVRAKSLAMQSSDELHEVLGVLFSQFDNLGIHPVNVFLSLFDKDKRTLTYRATGTGGSRTQGQQVVSLDSLNVWKELFEKWKNDNSDTVEVIYYEKEILPTLFGLLEETFTAMPENERLSIDHFPYGGYTMHGYTPFGYIGYNHTREATEEEKNILTRFATEFSRVYQRFLDIQKAEAQAREAQIEAALERVRSRSMAMHKSEELAEVSLILFEQVEKLGIKTWSTGFNVWLEDDTSYIDWVVNSASGKFLEPYKVDLTAHPSFMEISSAKKQGDDFFVHETEGETLEELYRLLSQMAKTQFEDIVKAGFQLPEHQINHYVFGSKVSLMFITFDPCPESHDIFKRFGKVFEQTYTRFLDLQKAEAQAREAQIEAALERVRSASMAMHKTDELGKVVEMLFLQFSELDLDFYQVWINIFRLEEGVSDCWFSPVKGVINEAYTAIVPLKPFENLSIKSWKAGEEFSYLSWNGLGEVDKVMKELSALTNHPSFHQVQKKKRMKRVEIVDCNHKYGVIAMAKNEDITDNDRSILKRFTKVFEQAYIRFLDLQKAEAQAREAQIEVALEKIRSRTMAMQKAEELGEVATVLFREMNALVENLWTCGFVLCAPNRQEDEWWLSLNNGLIQPFFLPNIGDYAHESLYEGWKKGESYRTVTLQDEVLQEHYDWLMNIPISRKIFEEMEGSGIPRPNWQRLHAAYFKTGYLVIITEMPCEEEEIFKRFAQVFDLTYTRFLDLQKAEKQARESQIEASLERVRAKALAMHNSEDLRQTITAIFEELKGLNIKTIRLGLGLVNPDSPEGEIVTSRIDEKDHILEVSGKFRLEGDPVLDSVYNHFKQQQDYFPILEGEEINSYYAALQGYVNVQGQGTDTKHFGCFLYFKEGCLYAWSAEPHSEGQIGILKKFSRVVEITYRRYKDLLESEYREKEAVKQASLDRVRAEIASMRNTNDLERITPLIWKELTTLGIPFLRCGVFIMDEQEELIHTFLSTPDGKAIAAFHLPYTSNPFFNAIEEWRAKKIHISHWDTEEFSALADSLVKEGQLTNREQYLNSVPKGGLHLHYVPFLQGIVYVGNTAALTIEDLQLVQSVADAFSTAYARYEDFVKLEQAKAKVESAMSELKATQSQLVQQEKLASLGQLTAGIAHEIKNPLNFVNNFSEVSIELIEEALEEIVKTQHAASPIDQNNGLDEIIAILDDVQSNLSKIHEHGTRANNIVSSMLQHSRGGSGKMEPTDLNALIKEYVNLSYHGMRAGKNSIDVDIHLNLDESIGDVSLIAEDFSRVILNLCNNAFDAMRTVDTQNFAYLPGVKSKSESINYTPKLTIRTKKSGDAITIEIEDNGSGIPDKIKDKILQPFFTTKKGTEGTGLGLSITNDIVKAHGGELSIESKSGQGTTFIISLPKKGIL